MVYSKDHGALTPWFIPLQVATTNTSYILYTPAVLHDVYICTCCRIQIYNQKKKILRQVKGGECRALWGIDGGRGGGICS